MPRMCLARKGNLVTDILRGVGIWQYLLLLCCVGIIPIVIQMKISDDNYAQSLRI